MKKAKEYYDEIKTSIKSNDEAEIKNVIAKCFTDIVLEIKDISETRKIKRVDSLKAVIREQNNKWNSICNKAESDGFDFLVRDAVQKYADKELLS